jgi:MFS family permease
MLGREPIAAARALKMRLFATVLAPVALGFLLSNLFRSVNAVIAPALVDDLGSSATDLGLLTGVYFLASAACQVPLGVFLDRFGPFRSQVVLLAIAALGSMIFALAERMDLLVLGRLLIGAGAAGGLMVAFSAIVLSYPPHQWPFINSCVLAAGGIGAMSATSPIQFLLSITDWRGVFLVFAAITGTAVVYTAVAERVRPFTKGRRQDTSAGTGDGLGSILRDSVFWRVAPLAAVTMGAGLAFQGLWACPWLRDVAELSTEGSVRGLFLMAVLMMAGFLLTGVVAQVANRMGVGLHAVISVCVLLFLLSQLPLVIGSREGAWIVLVGMGLLSNSAVLCYPLIAMHFPAHLVGRANTAQNLLFFGFTFAAQAGIGAIIELWPSLPGGAFAPAAYRAAMGVMLVLETLAYLWFLLAPRSWARAGKS